MTPCAHSDRLVVDSAMGGPPPQPLKRTRSSAGPESSSPLIEPPAKRPSSAPLPTCSRGPASASSAPPPPYGCHVALGRRPYQEDAHAACCLEAEEAVLFGVFDGHGGKEVSSYLAENTKDFVSRALAQHACKVAALKSAFVGMDKALPETENAGSTALVVLLEEKRMICANCGDSRAVVARGSQAVELSSDHKPDREDEEARIHKCGGQIINNGGARRVMGVLSMSRAIGDTWLQQYGVTPEPEVKVFDRLPDDELLILASDGLWDAVSSQEAVDMARRCVARAASKGASRKAACAIASKVLVRAATERGSGDNTTVIVVDLQRHAAAAAAPAAVAAAPIAAPEPAQPQQQQQQQQQQQGEAIAVAAVGDSCPCAVSAGTGSSSSDSASGNVSTLQRLPSAPLLAHRGRSNSDPARPHAAKAAAEPGASAWPMACLPRLLSAERIGLLVTCASAPPELLLYA